MKRIVSISVLALFAACAFVSCSISDRFESGFPKGDYATDGEYGAMGPGEGGIEDEPGGEEGDNGNSNAGVITAGEWNDLNNWEFWSGLMTGETFSEQSSYWGFYTNNRVAVKVEDASGAAVCGAKVELLRNGDAVWTAITDNKGTCSLWLGLAQQEIDPELAALKVSVNGAAQEGIPSVSGWSTEQNVAVNTYVVNAATSSINTVDIAFIVDATGSMHDEMDFLKEDLLDIVKQISAFDKTITIKTGTVFYRDKGDAYVTKHSQFTTDAESTSNYIKKQEAMGGGDYPEAVHTALLSGIQDLSWDSSAKAKIAFLLLDAPAHHESDVIKSLQSTIALYAQNGIRIIPIAASGVDKSTEFMLRFFAVGTNGTYVFITNDSGYGDEHIEASVGEYEVEQLNSLIVRLVAAAIE